MYLVLVLVLALALVRVRVRVRVRLQQQLLLAPARTRTPREAAAYYPPTHSLTPLTHAICSYWYSPSEVTTSSGEPCSSPEMVGSAPASTRTFRVCAFA